MRKHRFMISGGGTGGHIFPAISIADELKSRFPEAEFLFVGARDRMEMERIPQAGYNIEGIWISGIQRRLSVSNLIFPFKLFSSIVKCQRLLQKFRPDVVVGTGGFASGPLLYAASGKKIPTLIQEQNSYPGITNKLLASRVNTICVAYDKMERFFPEHKIVFTGNPVRQSIKHDIENRDKAVSAFGLLQERKTVLVLGGSLGARKINEIIGNNLQVLLEKNINLIWQTGKLYYNALSSQYGNRQGDQLKIQAFLKDMHLAYSAADIVISRAGAGTISELAVAGKATILIPSPNVAEDHQTKNALALVEKEAALLFRENESENQLLQQLDDLLQDSHRQKLEKNIAAMARPDAAAHIADEVVKLLKDAK